MSNNLNLTQMTTGQANKEATHNDSNGELDAALTEEVTIDVSSANQTISDANYRRAKQFKITGDGDAGRTVTLPAIKREVTFYNADSASRDLVRGSTTISIAAGASQQVYTDGTTNGLRTAGAATAGGTTSPIGKHTISMPAPAMKARTSNGAAAGSVETATNKVMIESFDFDASADEFVQFSVWMPKGWDEGTVIAVISWTAASGSGDVVWGIQALARSNDDALDTAFGTAVTVTDTLLTANDEHHTSETSAITIGGTPAENDRVIFQVYRDADAGGDTLAADAKLLAVKIIYTINAANDN